MLIEKLAETVNFLQKEGITSPQTGIVLGTGLGQMIKEIDIIKEHKILNILIYNSP